MLVWPGYVRLVGRDAEIQTMARVLDELPDRSRLVAIVGELGIGKSALLAELAELARRRGCEVLTGLPPSRSRSGSTQDTPVTAAGGRLGPWVEALDELAARLGPERMRALLGNHYEVLASVLPSLARPAETGPHPASPPVEQLSLFWAVRQLLRKATPPGLVLILDDLEQADEESIELLEYLLRRDLAASLLLAVAYRDNRRAGRLDALVAGALVANRADRIELRPLRPEETATLIGDSATRAQQRSLIRESGGNPLYLEVLLRKRRAASRFAGEHHVETAFSSELEQLSPLARAVSQAAAVLGESFTPEVVADVAPLDEQSTLAGIDELIDLDIVRPTAAARVFTFRHDLIRQAAYESAPPGQRLGAHGRAATALASRGAKPVDIAPHVERSTHQGDLAAVKLLAEAAAQLRPRHPHVEASWLRTALRVLPADGAGGYRLALLIHLASAHVRVGELSQSRDVLHEVLLLLPRGSGRARARAVSFCGMVEWLLGHREQATALLREELSVTADEEAAALLALRLACCELMNGELDSSQGWAHLALHRSERTGDRSVEAGSLAALAAAKCVAGDAPGAVGWLERAVHMLDAMIDSELTDPVDTLVWVGWAEIGLGRLDAALRHLDRALTLMRGTGEDFNLPQVLVPQLVALRRIGRLTEATRCCEEIADVAASRGSKELTVLAEAASWWLGTGRNDFATVAAETDTVLAEPVTGWYDAQPLIMMAEAWLFEGDAAGCLAIVEPLGGSGLPKVDVRSRVAGYEMLTRAEMALGRVEAAAAWARLAGELADQQRVPGCQGTALLARAEALTETDPGTAADFAAAALGEFTQAGMAVEAARARLARGTALIAVGDHQQAGAELASAQAGFAACGAPALARLAVRQRRRLAGRARRAGATAGRTGVDGLTSREREVGQLVSEGLTNRQIAQRLHVTAKTIEMHLSKVFAKLGVRSRAGVAGILAHQDGEAGTE